MPIHLLLLLTAFVARLAGLVTAAEEIAGKAITSVNLSFSWERIAVQRAPAHDYPLIVSHKNSRSTFVGVERDTGVARALLSELVEVAAMPSAAPVYVVVRAGT